MDIKRTIFTFVPFFVVVFIIMALGHILTVASAANNSSIAIYNSSPTIYLSYVDDGLGFYKIRNLDTTPRQFNYDDRILPINIGDTIVWENDADIDTFTIVSDQNLWNDQIGQIKVGQKINYKFDKPGRYTFYIKEASEKRQTIIVRDIEKMPTMTKTPTAIITKNPTPAPVATFTPISTITVVPNIPRSTSTQVPTYIIPDVENPVRMTPTSVASIIVATLSIYLTFRRKN
jgi:plastocyanin